jgi:hypothetical protein
MQLVELGQALVAEFLSFAISSNKLRCHLVGCQRCLQEPLEGFAAPSAFGLVSRNRNERGLLGFSIA